MSKTVLEYCKKGIHRFEPINGRGDMQCADCGYQEHKCDLECYLHKHKCENPKNLHEDTGSKNHPRDT